RMVDYSNIPRDSRRVPLETRVQFKFDRFSGFLSDFSSNVSPGGMFIRTRTPQPAGTVLEFEFRLGDGFELIRGRGEVVWTRTEDDGPSRPAGMGLRFQELSQGSKELIYRMVDHHIQQGGTPFDVTQGPPDPIPPPSSAGRHGPALPGAEPGEQGAHLPHGRPSHPAGGHAVRRHPGSPRPHSAAADRAGIGTVAHTAAVPGTAGGPGASYQPAAVAVRPDAYAAAFAGSGHAAAANAAHTLVKAAAVAGARRGCQGLAAVPGGGGRFRSLALRGAAGDAGRLDEGAPGAAERFFLRAG